jgi:hypothetical protein
MLPNDPILNKVINKCHFDVFLIYFKLENKVRVYYNCIMSTVVSFETKRSVLKCYTHFKRGRPDLNIIVLNTG